MNMTKIYELISGRITATLSIVALTLLTLYLSSLDTKISAGGDGVFSLFTAFTPERFAGVMGGWGIAGILHFRQYLAIDLVFAACCLVAFPSIIGLMFSQFSMLKTEFAGEQLSSVHYRIRNIVLSLVVAAVAANITSDVLLVRILTGGTVPTYVIVISAILQSFKMTVYVVALCYIVFLLMMRRKLIRKIR